MFYRIKHGPRPSPFAVPCVPLRSQVAPTIPTTTHRLESTLVADSNESTCEPEGSQQTRTRFEQAEVPAGEECVSEEQTRTCENGVWGAMVRDLHG